VRPLLVVVFAALALVLGAGRSEAQEASSLDPVQVAVTLHSTPLVDLSLPPLPSPLDAAPVQGLMTLATDPPLPAVLAVPDVLEATTNPATSPIGTTTPVVRDVAPPVAPVEAMAATTGLADLPSLDIVRPTVRRAIVPSPGPAPLPQPAVDLGTADDGVPPRPPAHPSTSVEGTCAATSPRIVEHGPSSGMCADAPASTAAGEPVAPSDARSPSSAKEHSITARGPPGGIVR
jgi:hypothetical protein